MLETRIGPRVGEIWRAHGGLERWREFAGVSFEYRGTFSDGTELSFPVTLLFGDARRLWVGEPGVEDAAGLAWTAVDLKAHAARVAPAVWNGGESIPRDKRARLDFVLHVLRDLFELPFGAAETGWELRLPVSPSPIWQAKMPDELALAPKRSPLLVGPYLVPWPDRSKAPDGRLERAYYASCHEAAPEQVIEVEFRSYQVIDGVAVATERVHSRRPRAQEVIASHDPLEWAPETSQGTPFLVEHLDRIRFLARDEVDAFRAGGDASEGTDAIDASARR